MPWSFVMLSILWQQSYSALRFSSEGVSSLLGVEPPSGRFAHTPSLLYWKMHWTVNASSAFLDCSWHKHPAQLHWFRLGVLTYSAIPVSLCTWGFELPLVLSSRLLQLCSLFSRQGTRAAPSTHCTWGLYWPGALWWFGLYSFLNYSTCFSDSCWTPRWHFQAFLCDNLKIFSLCGNSQLRVNTCT